MLARRRTSRLGALALAALDNLALLALLAAPGRDAFRAPSGLRPVEVTLAKPMIRRLTPPPPAAGSAAPSRVLSPSTPPATPASPAAPAPTTGPIGPSLSPGAPGLAATLRRGDVGCAHPDAPWMTAADRDACRDRLAAGATKAPYVSGMPAGKLAYYDAVAQAEADWRSGRDAGHPPFISCAFKFGAGQARAADAPPHALKLGPCILEPPKGSLDIDVDIPQPGAARPDDIEAAGANPIRHLGQ
jgi:hypothetical protein